MNLFFRSHGGHKPTGMMRKTAQNVLFAIVICVTAVLLSTHLQYALSDHGGSVWRLMVSLESKR